MSDDDAITTVRTFCDRWGAGDLDGIAASFTDDAVYHNIPMDPVHGAADIRTTIEGFFAMVDRIEFRIHHIAAAGTVVLTERTDVFATTEHAVELPVMGTFELAADGRISAWRDYFDLNQFMSKMS